MSPRQDVSNEVGLELEAMQAIAAALSRLPDPQARWRVLRWTTERFQAAPAAVAADRVVEALADPALAVDGLGDLFVAPELAVDDLHDVFDAPPMPSPRAAPRAVRDEPLDSLVRGFAAEFQHLALEWQRA